MAAMIRNCGIRGSSTSSSSPSGTPLSHHHGRRRMTLGMLLRSPIDGDRKPHPRQTILRLGIVNHDKVVGRNTLKSLMSSSSSKIFDNNTMVDNHDHDHQHTNGGGHGGRRPVRNAHGTRGLVTASTSFRIRIFKRAWRPALGVIPEDAN